MGKRMVKAVRRGRLEEVPEDEVDFELESPNQLFGAGINAIPLPSAVQAHRLFYGDRFSRQAVPLVEAEEPLVQNVVTDDPDGRSFEEVLGGKLGVVRSPADGKVEKVAGNTVFLRGADGTRHKIRLHHARPFNYKTGIDQTPVVKPGDEVKAGQMLARSNYTDERGTMALGRNARVAFVPYLGYSMDDATVISEDFARKLSSEHLLKIKSEFGKEIKGGMDHFVSLYPKKFTKDQLGKLDEKGVARPGQIIEPGDPLILATRPRSISSASADLGALSRSAATTRLDASKTWDGETPAKVEDVSRTRGGWTVVLRTVKPAGIGDKIVIRQGQKGTIAKILPMHRMPRTRDGRPMDMLFNQLGLPSRVNASTPYEAMLGKIAEKTGKPYKAPPFTKPGESWWDYVKGELDRHGLQFEEDLYDPEKDRFLERPVGVGNAYVLKLVHMAADKESARGQGSYTADEQPARGGGAGGQAKRRGGLETHALISSGAYKVVREGATLHGQKNDEYWRALRAGQTPRPPGAPFVWGKFRALLQGAGMQARALGKGRMRLGPWRDRDLDEKAREIRNGDILDMRTMEPVEGGLFDKRIVGANGWGRITLPHPVPNPAFEDAVATLLGLKRRELEEILDGERELPPHLRERLEAARNA